MVRGAAAVAGNAISYAATGQQVHHVLINGVPGVMAFADDRPISLMAFTIRDGKIVALDAIADPDRLSRLDLSALLPPH